MRDVEREGQARDGVLRARCALALVPFREDSLAHRDEGARRRAARDLADGACLELVTGTLELAASEIDAAERATILAALRYYQQQGQGDLSNRSDEIHDIATDGDNLISLDDEGIDALCEKVNFGETPLVCEME